jgi:hypothetical protein
LTQLFSLPLKGNSVSPAVNDLVFFDYPHQIDPRAPFDSDHKLMEVGGCRLFNGQAIGRKIECGVFD